MSAVADLVVRIRGDSSGLSKTLGEAQSKTSTWGRKLAGVGKLAGAALGAALGGAALAIGGFGIKIAAEAQQAQIGFETMLGSAEKARSFLGELREFASKTPFEFPELRQAASSLIAAGFEAKKVIPIMTSLGDVTSGMGTGAEGVKRATIALQQMSAAGRITGEDLNQLRDAGVPVFDLLTAATGRSKEEIAKMASAGKLGRVEMEALFKALETGKGLERFNGLMAKQSQTLTGLFSTLKDTLGNTLATVMGPLVQGITSAMPAITASLDKVLTTVGPKIGEALSTVMTAFAPLLGTALTALGGLLPPIASLASALVGALMPALDALVPAITQVVGLLAGELAKAMPTLAPALLAMAQALSALLIALMPLIPPLVQLLVVGIQPLILAMTALAFITTNVVAPALKFISTVVGGVIGIVARMAGGAQGASKVTSSAFSGLRAVAGAVFGAIGAVISGAASIIGGALGGVRAVVDGVAGAFNAVKSAVGGAVGYIVSKVQWLADRVTSILGPIGGAIARAFDFITPGSPIPAVENARAAAAGVADAFRQLVHALPAGIDVPMSASLAGVGGGGRPIYVTVNVDGFVGAPQELAGVVQKEVARALDRAGRR